MHAVGACALSAGCHVLIFFGKNIVWFGSQVHKRVRLAIRLDEVQRIQTKEKAEQSWRQRTADEVLFSHPKACLILMYSISIHCRACLSRQP